MNVKENMDVNRDISQVSFWKPVELRSSTLNIFPAAILTFGKNHPSWGWRDWDWYYKLEGGFILYNNKNNWKRGATFL